MTHWNYLTATPIIRKGLLNKKCCSSSRWIIDNRATVDTIIWSNVVPILQNNYYIDKV